MGKSKIKREDMLQKPSEKMKNLKRDLYDRSKQLILVDGLPFTGKTRATIEAGIEQVLDNVYEKLILIRPVIDPDCGFLKGSLLEKMFPYIRQSGIYMQKTCQNSIEELISKGLVEVLPASLLQGNRFENCFVVMDEFQNVPSDQMYAVLSRIGSGFKFVVLGDTHIGQQNRKIKANSLLAKAEELYRDKYYTAVHEFNEKEDILGDEVCVDVIWTALQCAV